ncbi:MAG: D-alanyl-D-alanine carboxypeptidase/D-alanyl-D-alanine-endopeptidase [Planctomycetota bacterium]|nr:D-alanyl-D-alanine carboxypeptidase/D-alanyl-D-alanine-endopeptidase [Planctomycetota bacterium]
MVRRFTCALFGSLAVVAGGASWAPGLGSDECLEREIRGLLGSVGLRPQDAAVAVVDANGELVVNLGAHRAVKPASNLKILTSLAALELLGADYEYETRISSTTPLRGGTVAGDLVVRGTGDPNISGRFYDGDPTTLFRTWARRLRRAGLVDVRGDLLVDDSFFDDQRFLPGWKSIDAGRWFAAEISPLSLNDNCIDVLVVPGRAGERARVEVTPESPFVKVTGAPVTVARGKTHILIRRRPDTNEVTVSGQIAARSPEWRDHVAVHDPALFFAHTLVAALRQQGIRVRGQVRRLAAARPGAAKRAGPAPRPGGGKPPLTLLVVHKSSLRLDLPVINKRSQNLHAEILLKTLGARSGGEGSVAGGARAIRLYLERQGIATSSLVVADGSGLSHDNRVTAAMLARALDRARRATYFEIFRDSLPVAGRDGTLAKRFRGEPQLHGRLFAKTGYIRSVSGLSGYLRRDGAYWSFSLLFQRLPGGNATIKRLQERIAATLDRAMARAAKT